MALIWIFVGFFLLLILGIPIAFALGIVSAGYLIIAGGIPLDLIPQRIFAGIDKYPLMAVPFFILAAELMIEIKILKYIVDLAHALVGHFRSGLAQVNVLNSVFFAGISGSAIADVGGMGPLEIAMMTEYGYPKPYAAAVTAASAMLGPIIPPSIAVIVYCLVVSEASVSALLMAGFVPGFMIAFALMITNYVIARKRNYAAAEKFVGFRKLLIALRNAILPLLMPAILLGGILLGVFTPTEAAAVACAYALFLGFVVLRTLRLKALPGIFYRAGLTTGAVFLIMGTCSALGWILASLQLAPVVEKLFRSISSNPLVFLLLVNIFLLMVGCLLEGTAAIIIFMPFLAPLAHSLGIHPIHFGIVAIVNLMVGLITPPVGLVLYVTCNVARIPLEELLREVWPYVVVEIIALLILTYYAPATLFVPKLFGLI